MDKAMIATDADASESANSYPTSSYSLIDLAKNQIALIEAIVENPRFGGLDAVVSQRLKDLGFLPNTPIRIVAKGLFGKPPYAVQLGSGVQFSLRLDELQKIRCKAL
ncbi:FeoA family protein [Psychrobacter sp. H7-1]|uniref:FeoA family protein n=1 Tax=Psychrobacter sp. H7-1 TaxID=1569265 RepID=UPI001919FFC2|nr:ferrous iron transport protein A [Psychrobacter sp. H7-1]